MRKRIVYVFAIAVTGVVLFASCRKNYHCQCSYQNQIRLNKDLGSKVKSDAQEECDSYDTTITGEKWTCILN
ncbi:MAG: hypothetical protein H7257_12710 [Taibaiella sp.]|nr:hypothetical protein [Taibaiella sp.]